MERDVGWRHCNRTTMALAPWSMLALQWAEAEGRVGHVAAYKCADECYARKGNVSPATSLFAAEVSF